jgi:hypothetical protein
VTRRTIVLGVLLICAVLLLCGCSSKKKSEPVSAQSVVGLWVNAAAKGQPASLSELGFSEDGSFRHSGSNALGLPVTFGGRYEVGTSGEGSVVRLTYDDFPGKPTTWYFELDGNTLTLAPSVADLRTETAVVLTRERQQ